MAGNEINYNRVRHWNFRQVVNSCGGVNEAARLLKKTNSNVSQERRAVRLGVGHGDTRQVERQHGVNAKGIYSTPATGC